MAAHGTFRHNLHPASNGIPPRHSCADRAMTATNDLFRKAEAHVRAGRLDAAREAYEAILATDPTDIRAAYRRAVVLLMAGDHGAGAAALTACLNAAPNDPDILFSLGRARIALNDHAGATEALTAGKAIAPARWRPATCG